MRKNLSPAEAALWSLLKGKALGFQVRRQYPIDSYFLDFYVPQARLCIELDGAEHGWRVDRDEGGDEALRRCGIETLRIKASDFSRNPGGAIETIYASACQRIQRKQQSD